jgi:protein-tyrosine phosphatase
MAQAYLQSLKPDWEIASAGTKRNCAGKPASEHAGEVIRQNGGSLAAHISRKFTSEMAQKYDIIFVMSKRNLQEAVQIAPEAAGKIRLLGGDKDIPNPFKGDLKKYQDVFECIRAAIDGFVNSVDPGR